MYQMCSGRSSVSVRSFQMAALLPPDRAKLFLLLASLPGRSFTLGDVLEAVQLNRDFPSALRFLSHSCPICQEQVTFSKVRDRSPRSSSSSRPCFHLLCLSLL